MLQDLHNLIQGLAQAHQVISELERLNQMSPGYMGNPQLMQQAAGSKQWLGDWVANLNSQIQELSKLPEDQITYKANVISNVMNGNPEQQASGPGVPLGSIKK